MRLDAAIGIGQHPEVRPKKRPTVKLYNEMIAKGKYTGTYIIPLGSPALVAI